MILLRGRAGFVALALATIAVGLFVHARGSALSPSSRDILGDSLWAMMIAWIAGALNPKARIMVRAAFALGVCWLVEFSQLYHASVLDSWRHHTIGQLTLGSGFDPRDLGAYALGIVAAVAIEIVMRRSRVMRIP